MISLAKTNVEGIFRDTTTNAVINTNDTEYKKIVFERKRTKDIAALQSDVEDLKASFIELKQLLQEIKDRRI